MPGSEPGAQVYGSSLKRDLQTSSPTAHFKFGLGLSYWMVYGFRVLYIKPGLLRMVRFAHLAYSQAAGVPHLRVWGQLRAYRAYNRLDRDACIDAKTY